MAVVAASWRIVVAARWVAWAAATGKARWCVRLQSAQQRSLRACRVRVCGVGKPRPQPGDVTVGVVLQLEGDSLCVGLCFEERDPGACEGDVEFLCGPIPPWYVDAGLSGLVCAQCKRRSGSRLTDDDEGDVSASTQSGRCITSGLDTATPTPANVAGPSELSECERRARRTGVGTPMVYT